MHKPNIVCGLDEVGRGPLAGPLLAAAVVFAIDYSFTAAHPDIALRDSKLLSTRQREKAYKLIEAAAIDVQFEVIGVDEINAKGIGWANRAVFERLIARVEADSYIVDGNLKLNHLGDKRARVRAVVRADQTEQVVAAASILAKLKRDWMMGALHKSYPAYGWDRNKGYGTPAHIAALREHGPCRLHRAKFVETALTRQYKLWAEGGDG
jgi:ribonuclease HII